MCLGTMQHFPQSSARQIQVNGLDDRYITAIRQLCEQKAELEEENKQLRAALSIYREIADRVVKHRQVA